MLCVAEIESNCGVSEPFQLGSEDHIKGVILVLVLSSRSQRKLGLTSRPERRCGCGSILKTRRQTIRKPCRLTDALTNKARADQTNPRSSARCGLEQHKLGLTNKQRDSAQIPGSTLPSPIGRTRRGLPIWVATRSRFRPLTLANSSPTKRRSGANLSGPSTSRWSEADPPSTPQEPVTRLWRGQCPLWVKSGHRNGSAECPLYSQ